MKGYSDNYNLIFKLYTNKHISDCSPISVEVKQWLINEREENLNIYTASEVEEKLLPIIDLSEKLILVKDEIECCSFNLNVEYVNSVLQYITELKTIFSLNYQSDEIRKRRTFADQELEKIRIHMQSTYPPKSFKELLKNLMETDFHNTLNTNLSKLKDKLNELRYVSKGYESRNKTLKEMLYDIEGLEFSQKHIHKYFEREKIVDEADLQKHYGIENALIHKLKKLKML